MANMDYNQFTLAECEAAKIELYGLLADEKMRPQAILDLHAIDARIQEIANCENNAQSNDEIEMTQALWDTEWKSLVDAEKEIWESLLKELDDIVNRLIQEAATSKQYFENAVKSWEYNKNLAKQRTDAIRERFKVEHPIAAWLMGVGFGGVGIDEELESECAAILKSVGSKPIQQPLTYRPKICTEAAQDIVEEFDKTPSKKRLLAHYRVSCSTVTKNDEEVRFYSDFRTYVKQALESGKYSDIVWNKSLWNKRQRMKAEPPKRTPWINPRNAKAEKKAALMKAQAAAHLKETRRLAKTVRKLILNQLEILKECPYCGGPLGADARADHIHPVSHGGLSTPCNMVYICYACNLKKSDMTLREFVKLMRLNWSYIEPRLDKLGKRY